MRFLHLCFSPSGRRFSPSKCLTTLVEHVVAGSSITKAQVLTEYTVLPKVRAVPWHYTTFIINKAATPQFASIVSCYYVTAICYSKIQAGRGLLAHHSYVFYLLSFLPSYFVACCLEEVS